MDAYGILVIMLSITLFIFLVLAIIVAYQTNKLLKKVHIVTDKALVAVENVENATESIRNAAESSIIGGIGTKIWQRFYDSQKKKR